jgi:hypothetical protein
MNARFSCHNLHFAKWIALHASMHDECSNLNYNQALLAQESNLVASTVYTSQPAATICCLSLELHVPNMSIAWHTPTHLFPTIKENPGKRMR